MKSVALPVTQFSWPNNWDSSASMPRPLHVEIGFGNGQFLVHMAEERSHEYFVGLEISLPSIRNAERKVTRAKLENVALVRGTALSALWLLFQPTSIRTLTINFPDPWPKANHRHRRVVNDKLLNLAASRMIPGGRVEIATDHVDYAAWIAEHLQRSPYFKGEISQPYNTRDQGRNPTKYELKAIRAGNICHYFDWTRNSVLPAEMFPIPEEFQMPHVVLESSANLDEIEACFKSKQFADGLTKVRFIALFHSNSVKAFVVDTFIHEEHLEQRILLSVSQRKKGEYLISVHEAGYPRSTRGVHLAVSWLSEWILGLNDETRIVRHNLKTDR